MLGALLISIINHVVNFSTEVHPFDPATLLLGVDIVECAISCVFLSCYF